MCYHYVWWIKLNIYRLQTTLIVYFDMAKTRFKAILLCGFQNLINVCSSSTLPIHEKSCAAYLGSELRAVREPSNERADWQRIELLEIRTPLATVYRADVIYLTNDTHTISDSSFRRLLSVYSVIRFMKLFSASSTFIHTRQPTVHGWHL